MASHPTPDTRHLKPASWTAPASPRIWRASGSGNAENVDIFDICSDEELARIADDGFTGVWVCGKLSELLQSTVFPELNDSSAADRVAGLQRLIERGRAYGIGVYLYFNDPVSLPIDHPFWVTHPDLKGATKWGTYALCTSTPEVQAFFRDALESVFSRLRGLAGVFLITACEALTHCWSKSPTVNGGPPPACLRCRDREPADLVLELLRIWSEVRTRQPEPFRLMAWNWEWAYWYADPQIEITGRLPEGVELLLDMEIGATRKWGNDRDIYIGEYSLGYVGPSQRFVATWQAVAEKQIPIHAKIQINNTHELCSVPNLPVIRTLHSKFKALVEYDVAGFLGCWSIGCESTLNTAALRLFLTDPARFMDESFFLDELARQYFGLARTQAVLEAWAQFSEAFVDYPITVAMVYRGPHNDAPARPLSLRFEGKPLGQSFSPGVMGDDLAPCLNPDGLDRSVFSLDETIEGFARMNEHWTSGLTHFEAALGEDSTEGEEITEALTEEQSRHRREELGVARMLQIQLRSILNVFRFYGEQRRAIDEAKLTPPCDIAPTPELLAIMAEEIANVETALPLLEADRRLGFHEEYGGYKYNAAMVRGKIEAMRAELETLR